MKKRKVILSLAGFDPCGGAGILADLKTFEQHKCVGMAVQTANTIQTEDEYITPNWISEDEILLQANTLLNRYQFDAFKIGLVPSFEFLVKILPILKNNNPKAIVVWDPILSASAGFDFNHTTAQLEKIPELVDWVTPNWNEMGQLAATDQVPEAAQNFSSLVHVYLKGGHHPTEIGKDFLYVKGKWTVYKPKAGNYSPKHGSGCVFSSALAANLAKGYPNNKAILRAKRYVERYLKSDDSKLGRHT